jgi:SNF2 family DNA or RNA helicase
MLLTASNTASTKWSEESKKYFAALVKLGPRPIIKHKATVIAVPPTLLGQWMDEFKKFAPTLKVYSLHKGTGKHDYKAFVKSETLARNADVLLVSKNNGRGEKIMDYPSTDHYFGNFHSIRGDPAAQFHRVIVDEAHIGSPPTSANAALRWAITGTPCSKSPADLCKVLAWLGLNTIKDSIKRHSKQTDMFKNEFQAVVSDIQKLMIRHSKAMQISGSATLVLPTLESKTIFLDMSTKEKKVYQTARTNNLKLRNIVSARQYQGATIMSLEMNLTQMRDACSGLEPTGTKMNALKKSLEDLKVKQPTFNVIVFTRYKPGQQLIRQMAEDLDLETYDLTSNSDMKKRHESIRAFQAPGKQPRLLIASVNIGSVGVTLTAATRVYLMEPCIDPAAEIQCKLFALLHLSLVVRGCYRILLPIDSNHCACAS